MIMEVHRPDDVCPNPDCKDGKEHVPFGYKSEEWHWVDCKVCQGTGKKPRPDLGQEIRAIVGYHTNIDLSDSAIAKILALFPDEEEIRKQAFQEGYEQAQANLHSPEVLSIAQEALEQAKREERERIYQILLPNGKIEDLPIGCRICLRPVVDELKKGVIGEWE